LGLMSIASFLAFLGVYVYMTPNESEKTPQTTIVTPPKKIVESAAEVYLVEDYALCMKIGLACRTETLLSGNAREELANNTEQEIIAKYPAEAGWTVTWQGTRLYLAKTKPGMCPEHKERWHLGVNQGGDKVAVYLGPAAVGTEGGLIRETELRLALLPADIQQRIINRAIEFLDWEELIATLDSLEEYIEE